MASGHVCFPPAWRNIGTMRARNSYLVSRSKLNLTLERTDLVERKPSIASRPGTVSV